MGATPTSYSVFTKDTNMSVVAEIGPIVLHLTIVV